MDSLVTLVIGRRNDKYRIYVVTVLFMLAIVYLKRPDLADRAEVHVRRLSARMMQPHYEGAHAWRQHGILGRRSDGTAGWEPGEKPPTPHTQEEWTRELKDNGFFFRLSESLPLDRNVTDFRHAECKQQIYDLKTLPRTSVIFVFANEAFSTLMRSVHSVLNRTPPELLEEIILVDDASTKAWLGRPLEDYIKLLPKVRLVRLPERSGLVKARLRGVQEARSETFTILDSHIEVQEQWLEPLMQRIGENSKTVVMPIIDSLEPETFKFSNGGIGCTLGFLWSMVEHGIDIQKQDQARRHSEVDPVRSPAMAGGLFAANREYFWHLGGYDTEFGFWGTENLEISFRIWQCGGSLECMPCSRVYHVFRAGGTPYKSPSGHLSKNKLRTAAVWMDDYGFLVEKALQDEDSDIGPLKHMRDLRAKLQCKSFDWFLKNVYPESIITDLSDLLYMGDVQQRGGSNLCLRPEAQAGEVVATGSCSGHDTHAFVYLNNNELRLLTDMELCLGPDASIGFCEQMDVGAKWDYNPATGQLRHLQSNQCLTAPAADQPAANTDFDDAARKASLTACSATTSAQQWVMRKFERSMAHPARAGAP
eukprot:m.174822 g.174822  ORF g.174822 m.174822 type:complete len:592 (+) comp21341_c1_seq1:116-1891(+)